jgi:hypothetical protein
MKAWKAGSGFKIPIFTAGPGDHHTAGIILEPGLSYMEKVKFVFECP